MCRMHPARFVRARTALTQKMKSLRSWEIYEKRGELLLRSPRKVILEKNPLSTSLEVTQNAQKLHQSSGCRSEGIISRFHRFQADSVLPLTHSPRIHMKTHTPKKRSRTQKRDTVLNICPMQKIRGSSLTPIKKESRVLNICSFVRSFVRPCSG